MDNNNTKIEKCINNDYEVFAWKNGWITVSKHLYKTDAEEIYSAIANGQNREQVKELVANQDQRCNTLMLKYNENWN